MENDKADLGDNGQAATGGVLVPIKQASEAQLKANRDNAKRSTGPRTAEGKARSGENAVKHGLYATKCAAILTGPYPEDQDELDGQVRAVIAALAPRDVLEAGTASEIALICLKERRVAAFEDGQLLADERVFHFGRFVAGDVAGAAARREIGAWDRARIDGDASIVTAAQIDFPWKEMATYLKASKPSREWVADLWTETVERDTPLAWRDLFEVLVSRFFPAPHDLGIWLRLDESHREDASIRTSLAASREVALNSMAVLERGTQLRTRLLQDKVKLLAVYEMFKSRELR
ncbi:MAG: hypothetical protein JWP74_3202 [Marmoricola sp.]|nr:hypothetical protein [Marmoricola sp.]